MNKINSLAIATVLLLLLQFTGGTTTQTNDPEQCPDGKRSVVFDMTSVTQSNKSDAQLAANVSKTFFYYETIAYWPHAWNVWCSPHEPVKIGLSLLYTKKIDQSSIPIPPNNSLSINQVLKLLSTNDSSLYGVALKVSSFCYCHEHNAVSFYLEKIRNMTKARKVKLGVEYTPIILDCCRYNKFDSCPFVFADFAVLNVELSPGSTMLSYGMFSKYVSTVIDKNRDKLEKVNPNICSYIRLVYSNRNDVVNETKVDRFNALMNMFATAWIGKVPAREMYIIPPFPPSAVEISDNNQFLKENVASRINAVVGVLSRVGDDGALAQRASEQIGFLRSVHNHNIFFYNPTAEYLGRLPKDQFVTKANQNVSVGKPYLNIIYCESEDYSKTNFKAINNQLKKLTEISFPVKNLFLDYTLMGAEPKHYTGEFRKDYLEMIGLLNVLRSNGTNTGCFFHNGLYENDIKTNVWALQSDSIDNCGQLFPADGNVLHNFKFLITHPQGLLASLAGVQKAKQLFEEKYPAKQFVPFIELHVPVKEDFPGHLKDSPLYCDSTANLENELYQTVLSFANIHQWAVLHIASDLFDPDRLQVWKYVESDDDIHLNKSTGFPVFYRTNSEIPLHTKLPMTFACLKRTEEPEKAGVNFVSEQNSGATFEIILRRNNESLSTSELQRTLQFVMERFPFTELIGKSKQDFHTVSAALSPALIAAIASFHRRIKYDKPLVYLEIPMNEFISLQEAQTMSFPSYIAIHVSNWESYKWGSNKTVPLRTNNFPSNFGISVQSCSDEINTGLERLKKLPFLNKINYVVCIEKPVIPNYLDAKWMFKYLSNIFYKKKYIDRFLFGNVATASSSSSPKDVMFRINLISRAIRCARKYDTEIFLRFLSEVNQHGAAYGVKYFLVRAFSKEVSTETCPYSWWRLESYSDLTNVAAYVGQEEEYFGRPTKLRIQLPDNKNNEDKSVTKLLYLSMGISIPTVVVLLLILLSVCMYYRRTQEMLLSRREVQQFYNGATSSPDEMTMVSSDLVDAVNMKFPKSFEIPVKDVETNELIGAGQFGCVHKGILCKRLEIAIKTTRQDCGKDQFLSTLSELKILCYIGAHENIVSFLGACTKDIAFGKLLIVMEFCSKGSLLGYLREVRGDQEKKDDCVASSSSGGGGSVDLYQLILFAHQVASGMEYISSKKVVHADLAARNILMTSQFTCKVADFGLSRQLYELGEYRKTSREPVPWKWMAPESLRDMVFSTKSDVWSYGVTLWEIFSLGQAPYPDKNWTDNFVQELETGMRMGKSQYASDEIYGKMLSCWNAVPDERPTFTEIKSDLGGLRNGLYVSFDRK